MEQASQPFRPHHHHQDEQQAIPEQPGLGQATQDVTRDEIQDDAEDRPPEIDQPAADQDHHHDQAGLVQAHHVGIGALLRHGEQSAGQTGKAGRYRESKPFPAPDIITDKPGAGFVLTNRLQHATEGCVCDAPQCQNRDGRDGGHKPVEGRVVVEIDAPGPNDQIGSRDAQQAVLATGDAVQLHGGKPEDLPEGDGQQRVIDAAAMR